MSLFESSKASCPSCGAPNDLDLAGSVNADRRPDLRDAVLDDSFQRIACVRCGDSFRPDPVLTWLDLGQHLWLSALPAEQYTAWAEAERTSADVYARSFGERASKPARALGAGLRPRLVFGWPALREKVICSDAQIDDADLELVKLLLIQASGDPPLADNVELRLVAIEGDELVLRWLRLSDQANLEELRVDRGLLEDVHDDAFQPLRADLSQGLYVDLNRLLVAPT